MINMYKLTKNEVERVSLKKRERKQWNNRTRIRLYFSADSFVSSSINYNTFHERMFGVSQNRVLAPPFLSLDTEM